MESQFFTNYLHLIPETGQLFWKHISKHHKEKIGREAGWITKEGYRRIKIGNKNYAAHRIVWCIIYNEWPNNDIDHINRNRLDNRPSNLRHISRSLNALNTNRTVDKCLKNIRKLNNKYQVRIGQKSLGVFNCLGLAIKTRNEYLKQVWIRQDRDKGYEISNFN